MTNSFSFAKSFLLEIESLEERLVPSTAAYVVGLYQTLLQRNPSPGEVTAQVAILDAGDQSPPQVAQNLTRSKEYLTNLVSSDYQQFLGRSPASAETVERVALLEGGLSPTDLAAGILASPEFFQAQGGTPGGWLEGVFKEVLGRSPGGDEAGVWAEALQAGDTGQRAAVALDLLQSPESGRRLVTAAYAQVLGRDPEPQAADLWAENLARGMTQTQLEVTLAGSAELIHAHGGLDVVSPLDALATTASPLTGTDNPTWTQREKDNEARAAQGHAPIVFLGDSITDFFANGAGQPVWDNFLAPLGAVDFGISGITTSQLIWQAQTDQLTALSPNVVVLMIGTNNLTGQESPQAVANGIVKSVAEIEARSPGTKILLLGIFPRGASPSGPYRGAIAEVNALIAPLADNQRVWYLNIGQAFLQPDGTLPTAVMPDGVHPSLYGYEIWTASIWDTLHALDGE